MNCVEFTTAIVCFTPAVGPRRNLVAHYAYGPDALGVMRLTSTRFTEADGVTVIDTSSGEVHSGVCPIAGSDPVVTYPVAQRVSSSYDVAGTPMAVSIVTFTQPLSVSLSTEAGGTAFELPPYTTWTFDADMPIEGFVLSVEATTVEGPSDALVTTIWAAGDAPLL